MFNVKPQETLIAYCAFLLFTENKKPVTTLPVGT